MMNAKNFKMFVVAAPLAFGKHFAGDHDLADRRISSAPYSFVCFIDARFRAVFSLVRRRIQKPFFTMLAYILNGAFSVLSFVVARCRAVFCAIGATRYVRKLCSAFRAISDYRGSSSQAQAFTATVKGSIFSIVRNGKFGAAMPALFLNPNSGAYCATH